jgi:hypothetical protein
MTGFNASTIVVALIVLTAVTFIGRKAWTSLQRSRSNKAGCSDCGCGSSASDKTDWSKT